MHAPQTSTAAEPVLLREASTPNVCPFARDAEAPGLRVDRFAMLFLSLARFVGAAYATDEAGCWEAAHRCADDAVGPIEGPLFVARAAALVRAIRRYRDRDFVWWLGVLGEWDAKPVRSIPGMGSIPWPEFFSVLQSVGYDGAMSIEHEDNLYGAGDNPGPDFSEPYKVGFRMAKRYLDQYVPA